MKQVWQVPVLEVLDVSLTMGGPGKANPDCFDTHDSDLPESNASCLHPVHSS